MPCDRRYLCYVSSHSSTFFFAMVLMEWTRHQFVLHFMKVCLFFCQWHSLFFLTAPAILAHICAIFSYCFVRACLRSFKITLWCSRFDTAEAETKRFLRVPFLYLGSLYLLFLRLGPGWHFSKDCFGPCFCRFSDRQPPTLTALVEQLKAVLHQNDQPVA